MVIERTPKQWFAVAERSYIENHQGCAWCGGSYRVYKTNCTEEEAYQCNHCDFQVGREKDEDRYFVIPGEDISDAPTTMHQFDHNF